MYFVNTKIGGIPLFHFCSFHFQYLSFFHFHSFASLAQSFCFITGMKTLKLYCSYEYTKPCMINFIWGLKQLWLQVNGHAWFHLQRLCWPVRNGEGAKKSKWKYMSTAGFEPTQRQSSTGKSAQRLRPLGHEGLIVISDLMAYRLMGYKF